MANAAVNGLANAKKAGQLRKDAAVQGRKSNIGKRNDYGGSISKSPSKNGSLYSSSLNNAFRNNFKSSLTSRMGNNSEAKKRLKREKQLDKAIKVAEKIPVANKYAKIAKAAKKVASIKKKKAGLFGGFFGGGSDSPSNSEIRDARIAEEMGEEYNPENTEGNYSVKLDRKTKWIFVGIVFGIMFSGIFICILVLAAITGGGKESYLASHENPTEAELEEAYNSSEDFGENTGTSAGTYTSSLSSYTTGTVDFSSTSNIIMVGDSRTVGLCQSTYNGSSCSTLDYKTGNTTFIAKGGESYSWLSGTALSHIKAQLDANKKSTVFINMGTNGLNDADKYANLYKQLAKDYKEANIVAVSVTPIIDSKVTYYKDVEKDSNVVAFNNKLKSALSSSDVIYCDVYSQVNGKVDASDGVHYDNQSYKKINEAMMNCIKGNSSGSNTSFENLLSKGNTSVSQLNQKNIKQLVIVESLGSTGNANIYFYENSSNGWNIDSSLSSSGHVGENGTIDGDKHSENTKKTPKGLYGIGQAFYKNNEPSTKLDKFVIKSNTYWIDDPNSKYYNQRVEGNSNKDWNSYEDMSNIPYYNYGFVINFNMNPVVKNLGSAIFFHIDYGQATSGCITVPEEKVVSYLAKLDKNKNPHILIF